MTDPEILQLVERMREAQKRYFKMKDRADLQRSKELEGQVDRILLWRFAPDKRLL